MPPVLLEIFKGTGSIGRAFAAQGWTIISVDINPEAFPTHCMDVREIRPEMLEQSPDLIWASPVCTAYSRARTTAKTPRDFEWADSLVQAVLDLSVTLRCPAMFENPESGLLKGRPLVQGIPYRIIDYCMYADHRFTHCARKRTAIWCIDVAWQPQRPLCKKDCGFCIGNRHIETAQQGPGREGQRRHTLAELYAMPPILCEEITTWATSEIFGV